MANLYMFMSPSSVLRRMRPKPGLLAQEGCLLAHNKSAIPKKDLSLLMELVTLNHSLICDEWRKWFHGDISFYR